MKLTRKNQNKNLGSITMYSAESNAYQTYQAGQQLCGGWQGCGGGITIDINLPSSGYTTGAGVALGAQKAMEQALKTLNK